MAVITFPTTLQVEKFSWGQKRNDAEFRSSFGSQAVEISPPWWTCSVVAPSDYDNLNGGWQALLMQTRGKTNQVSIGNLGRPLPLGTCRGTMSLASAASQGDTFLAIAVTGQTGNTLVAGDYLGVGSGLTQQIVMVIAATTATSSGINVSVEPAIRNAIAIGNNVTWNYPQALFRRNDSAITFNYDMNFSAGFQLNLIEDPRP